MAETKLKQLPRLIPFATHGNPALGFLCTTDNAEQLPFAVKRVFWTFKVPDSKIRGNHAHRLTHELLVCVCGKVKVEAEIGRDQTKEFVLDSPETGLHLPPLTWIKLYFDDDTVLLGLSSGDYDRSEYVEDYDEYRRLAYADSE